VTANTLVQGQKVEGQGHSVCNRQDGFTAKFVGLCYLFQFTDGRFHDHAVPNDCQADVHKQCIENRAKPKNPGRLARCRSALQTECCRNCTLSSSHVCHRITQDAVQTILDAVDNARSAAAWFDVNEHLFRFDVTVPAVVGWTQTEVVDWAQRTVDDGRRYDDVRDNIIFTLHVAEDVRLCLSIICDGLGIPINIRLHREEEDTVQQTEE